MNIPPYLVLGIAGGILVGLGCIGLYFNYQRNKNHLEENRERRKRRAERKRK